MAEAEALRTEKLGDETGVYTLCEWERRCKV